MRLSSKENFLKYSHKSWTLREGRISKTRPVRLSSKATWYLESPVLPLNSSIERTSGKELLDTLNKAKILKTVLEETLAEAAMVHGMDVDVLMKEIQAL